MSDFIPRIIFWETTKLCNLKCGYCRRLAGDSADELDTKEAFGALAGINKAFGSPLVVLSGGEPLLREDIFEIISQAVILGLPLAFASNGVLLGEKEARMLKSADVRRVSLSLDSADERKHDLSRGVHGAFRKTREAAGILQREGLAVQINHTVTKSCLDELEPVARLALSLGAVAVHYFVLVPVGCGRQMEKDSMLGAEESEQALGRISALTEELPLEIRATCAPQYVRFSKDRSETGCIAGTAAFFISSEGDVYPCGYLPVKAGSLRQDSARDIWEGAAVFKELRENNLKGGCSVCELKDRCRGCRARAFSLCGDYMASDQTCVLEKRRV